MEDKRVKREWIYGDRVAGMEVDADVGRRAFLRTALTCAAGLVVGSSLHPGGAWAFPSHRTGNPRAVKRFAFAQLRYHGGNWDPSPGGVAPFLVELENMTSVEARPDRVELTLESADLFSYPFLYVTGRDDFTPFPSLEVERLRLWLNGGGTLMVDDAAATPGYGFDTAIRRELARVLPGERFVRLTSDHTVYKSFFLIRGVGGRAVANPFLEGITVQGRTAVLFCPNDLGGAWVRDPLGRWVNPCVPGGERQRFLAIQTGINIVMYALCSDYKQDRIHLPFLRQRI